MIPAQQLQHQIENHLLIENKERQLVRFHLNRIQALYNQQRSNRDIILKARQFGFTSAVLAEFTLEALTVPNTRVVIVAQLQETAVSMLRKVRMYIERFYDGDEFVPIPLEVESSNEIRIRETNSTIYIGTAGSKKFGRGDTVHRLLLTEFAFYENPGEIFTGIVQAVPASGRIVIETTANGYNHLRNLYFNAKAGGTVWKAMFFPWFWHEEYTLPGPAITEKSLEEIDLQNRFPEVTDDRLRWYRQKKREMPDPRMMQQEYPATDYEAFISSGNKVFSPESISVYLKEVKPPLLKGNVDRFGMFSTDPDGFIWVWKLPELGKSYVVFGDPSSGLSQGDPAGAIVMERVSGDVVATWHGHKDPDLFGEDLVGLGTYYREAVVGPEANNHGIATIIKMRDLGYKNIYTRVSYDTVSQKNTQVLGWRTDLKTKPMMINEGKAFVREHLGAIPDERILLEMLAYEEKEPTNPNQEYRKLGAAIGAHDELVIAYCGCLQLRKFTPQPFADDLPTTYLKQPYGNRNQNTNLRT